MIPSQDLLVICVDFDGVLHRYDHYRGVDVFNRPVDGASEGMQYLHNQGHTLILWTTRPITEKLKAWLAIHGIPIDYYNENPNRVATGQLDPRKPVADIYLDDRGITFEGDWPRIIHVIENFKVWYRR